MKTKIVLILIAIIGAKSFAIDQFIGITYSQIGHAKIMDTAINNVPNISAYYQINVFKFVGIKNEFSYGWKLIAPYSSEKKLDRSMVLYSDNVYIGFAWFNKSKSIGFSLSPSIGIIRAENKTKYKKLDDTLNFNTSFWGIGLNRKVELIGQVRLANKINFIIGTEYIYQDIELNNLTIQDKSQNLWGISFLPRSYFYHDESLSFKLGLAYSL